MVRNLKGRTRIFAAVSLLILLLLLVAGCIHYEPRPEETEGSAVHTTQSPVTTEAGTFPPVTDAPVTGGVTDSAGFPNEPEDDATKRY